MQPSHSQIAAMAPRGCAPCAKSKAPCAAERGRPDSFGTRCQHGVGGMSVPKHAHSEEPDEDQGIEASAAKKTSATAARRGQAAMRRGAGCRGTGMTDERDRPMGTQREQPGPRSPVPRWRNA
jgi:hypothetical protein